MMMMMMTTTLLMIRINGHIGKSRWCFWWRRRSYK